MTENLIVQELLPRIDNLISTLEKIPKDSPSREWQLFISILPALIGVVGVFFTAWYSIKKYNNEKYHKYITDKKIKRLDDILSEFSKIQKLFVVNDKILENKEYEETIMGEIIESIERIKFYLLDSNYLFEQKFLEIFKQVETSFCSVVRFGAKKIKIEVVVEEETNLDSCKENLAMYSKALYKAEKEIIDKEVKKEILEKKDLEKIYKEYFNSVIEKSYYEEDEKGLEEIKR